jgi:hypothetical protein
VADRIGISTSLWIGAAWIVVTTIAVLSVPSVRNFRSPADEHAVPMRGESDMHLDEPVGQPF